MGRPIVNYQIGSDGLEQGSTLFVDEPKPWNIFGCALHPSAPGDRRKR